MQRRLQGVAASNLCNKGRKQLQLEQTRSRLFLRCVPQPRVRRQQQPVGEWLVPSNMSLIIEVRVISHVARQARTPCPFPTLPILPLTRSAVARFVSAAPCGVPCGNSDACHRFCIVCILDSIALEWLSVCVCVLPTPLQFPSLLPPATLTTTRQSALSISNFQLNIHSLIHSLTHSFIHSHMPSSIC